MIGEDDARMSLEFDDHFVIQPSHSFWNPKDYLIGRPGGRPCADGYSYASDTNSWFLADAEIAALVRMVERDGHVDVKPVASEPTFIVGG